MRLLFYWRVSFRCRDAASKARMVPRVLPLEAFPLIVAPFRNCCGGRTVQFSRPPEATTWFQIALMLSGHNCLRPQRHSFELCDAPQLFKEFAFGLLHAPDSLSLMAVVIPSSVAMLGRLSGVELGGAESSGSGSSATAKGWHILPPP
jgi:hypothetical protein